MWYFSAVGTLGYGHPSLLKGGSRLVGVGSSAFGDDLLVFLAAGQDLAASIAVAEGEGLGGLSSSGNVFR